MGPVILRVLPTACRQSFSGGARIPYSKNEILREYLRMTNWWVQDDKQSMCHSEGTPEESPCLKIESFNHLILFENS